MADDLTPTAPIAPIANLSPDVAEKDPNITVLIDKHFPEVEAIKELRGFKQRAVFKELLGMEPDDIKSYYSRFQDERDRLLKEKILAGRKITNISLGAAGAGLGGSLIAMFRGAFNNPSNTPKAGINSFVAAFFVTCSTFGSYIAANFFSSMALLSKNERESKAAELESVEAFRKQAAEGLERQLKLARANGVSRDEFKARLYDAMEKIDKRKNPIIIRYIPEYLNAPPGTQGQFVFPPTSQAVSPNAAANVKTAQTVSQNENGPAISGQTSASTATSAPPSATPIPVSSNMETLRASDEGTGIGMFVQRLLTTGRQTQVSPRSSSFIDEAEKTSPDGNVALRQ